MVVTAIRQLEVQHDIFNFKSCIRSILVPVFLSLLNQILEVPLIQAKFKYSAAAVLREFYSAC